MEWETHTVGEIQYHFWCILHQEDSMPIHAGLSSIGDPVVALPSGYPLAIEVLEQGYGILAACSKHVAKIRDSECFLIGKKRFDTLLCLRKAPLCQEELRIDLFDLPFLHENIQKIAQPVLVHP